jgi:hypothetical protein
MQNPGSDAGVFVSMMAKILASDRFVVAGQ